MSARKDAVRVVAQADPAGPISPAQRALQDAALGYVDAVRDALKRTSSRAKLRKVAPKWSRLQVAALAYGASVAPSRVAWSDQRIQALAELLSELIAHVEQLARVLHDSAPSMRPPIAAGRRARPVRR